MIGCIVRNCMRKYVRVMQNMYEDSKTVVRRNKS